jgi:hypothetical protein
MKDYSHNYEDYTTVKTMKDCSHDYEDYSKEYERL